MDIGQQLLTSHSSQILCSAVTLAVNYCDGNGCVANERLISLAIEGLTTDSPILRSLTLSPSTPVVLFDDVFAKYVANF